MRSKSQVHPADIACTLDDIAAHGIYPVAHHGVCSAQTPRAQTPTAPDDTSIREALRAHTDATMRFVERAVMDSPLGSGPQATASVQAALADLYGDRTWVIVRAEIYLAAARDPEMAVLAAQHRRAATALMTCVAQNADLRSTTVTQLADSTVAITDSAALALLSEDPDAFSSMMRDHLSITAHIVCAEGIDTTTLHDSAPTVFGFDSAGPAAPGE